LTSIVSILSNAAANTTSKRYSPDLIHVIIGVNNTVTWMNNDGTQHAVTSDSGLFDSGSILAGESWSYTFTTPGTYKYHCAYHYWMTGEVIVLPGM
jgi:plastocyanin